MQRLVRWDPPVEGLAHLTIDRPQARNALTWEAMRQFSEAVEAAHADADTRCLVVTGGPEAFCAGGDLVELDGYPTRLDGARLSLLMAGALDRLESLPFPVIASMEGPALGGGAEIALACDLRVMADGSTLGMMHVRLAITPAWGGGQRLLRLTGYARAMEILACGKALTAQEALEAGLANRRVSRGEALAEATRIARTIAQQDPAAVRAVKRLLQGGLQLPADDASQAERSEFPDLWAAPAHLEASGAFIARRNHKPRLRA
ncbi:MAG TPA: enoyl-CoA hydratase/isomerase family protein [Anaerolineales bacterium]|nr:enoyl-CoA hydratase/isomerase family protein [Anaerolineales bacterium]